MCYQKTKSYTKKSLDKKATQKKKKIFSTIPEHAIYKLSQYGPSIQFCFKV